MEDLPEEGAVSEGKHVLVADDEEGFRFSVSVALRRAGYRVTEAADGIEALAMLVLSGESGDPVDLLVTDVRMPQMSGDELVATLRGLGVQVPVFVVTGHRDFLAAGEAVLAGTNDQMEKPVNPDEFLCRVASILDPAAA